jgi:hypothetical protein
MMILNFILQVIRIIWFSIFDQQLFEKLMYRGNQPDYCKIYTPNLKITPADDYETFEKEEVCIGEWDKFINYITKAGAGFLIFNSLESLFRSFTIYIFYLQIFEWIV